MNTRLPCCALPVVLVVALSTTAPWTTSLVGGTQPPQDPLRAVQVVPEDDALAFDVSSDGRAIILATHAFVGGGTDENPARLLLRDLHTNATRQLNPGASYGPPTRPAGALSPDGSQIVFAWTERIAAGSAQVRSNMSLVNTRSDAAPRTLAGQGAVPHGWSPDGKSILFLQHAPGASIADPTSLNWFATGDGTVRLIKTLEPFRGGAAVDTHPCLSPDGASIAYSAIARDGSAARHIFVIDADGRNERAVVTLEGSNTQPVWTPDSTHIVFANARSGHRDLYAVSVRKGGPVEPVGLQAGFSGDLLRIAESGDLFYVEYVPDRYQVIAEKRPNGARVVRVLPGMSGTWSKTNKLAFLRFGPEKFLDLAIQSADSHQERVYPHAAIGTMPPRWFSDESGVIVLVNANGDGGQPGGAFYRVDAQTGEFQRLFAKDTPDEVRSFVGVLSPDDRTFYLAARPRSQPLWTRIVAVEVVTGVERPVVTISGAGLATPPAVAITPDGATLAIHTEDGRTMTVRSDGTQYRELEGPFPGFANPYGRAAAGSPAVMQWTPDGNSIVFAARTSASPAGWRLMKVPANGGTVEFDGFDSSRVESAVPLPQQGVGTLDSIDISPSGAQVTFSARIDPSYLVWKLPDVVSAIRSRK